MKPFDYSDLNQLLLSDVNSHLRDWLPGGRLIGNEYTCGNIHGNPGNSFKVNIKSGRWADFADKDKSGIDLISLYAKINGVSNSESYKKLAKLYSIDSEEDKPIPKKVKQSIPGEVQYEFTHAPEGEYPITDGKPTNIWSYRDKDARLMFYIYRYDLPNGKKIFTPWSYTKKGEWVKKSWSQPMPLYNLELLYSRPNKHIIIVEGEKAADAAQKIAGKVYNVVTWPGGANAWQKANWSILKGKNILLWPDNDKAGLNCMYDLAQSLEALTESIKVLNITKLNLPKKWDAFDALEEGMTWDKFKAWAKPIVTMNYKDLINEDKTLDIVDKPTKVVAQIANKPIISKDNNTNSYEIELPDELISIYETLGVNLYKSSGIPINNISNAAKLIDYIFNRSNPESDPKTWTLWFDVFHQNIFTTWRSDGGKPRVWTDNDDLELTYIFESKLGFSAIERKKITDAVNMISHRYMKHEIRDYLKELNWDQTPRVETFLHTYLGVENTKYSRDVSKNFLISMIARIFDPGCKVDNMLMIEGKQGIKKTTAIEALATKEKVLDTSEKLTSREFKRSIRGKWVIELAELESLNGCGPGAIKQLVSSSVDWDRNPYEVRGNDYRRECIFIGTTNTDNYLIDNTGARRFWPVRATKSDTDAIKRDRDQILAEALHLYNSGQTWWEEPDGAEEEQSKRNFIRHDVVYESVQQYISDRSLLGHDFAQNGVKLSDVWKFVREDIGSSVQQSKIKSSLMVIGFERSSVKKDGYNLWYPKTSL